MDEELNATQRTLARLNNKNVDPELVAVVQYNETDDTTVLLLNNQEVTDGEGVVYKGKKFPVQLDLLTLATCRMRWTIRRSSDTSPQKCSARFTGQKSLLLSPFSASNLGVQCTAPVSCWRLAACR